MEKQSSSSTVSNKSKDVKPGIREQIEAQLRTIHPKLKKAPGKSGKSPRFGTFKLIEPKWKNEITKRQFEAILPHCRRGSANFKKGRDDGFELGELTRDLEAALQQKNLPNKEAYVSQLDADIQECCAEKRAYAASLPIKNRRDFNRGFMAGLQFASNRPAQVTTTDFDQDGRILNPTTDEDHNEKLMALLWNRMPLILTSCRSIPELFKWVYNKPALKRTRQENLSPVRYTSDYLAFQKLCSRLGIKLRSPGRPRKI